MDGPLDFVAVFVFCSCILLLLFPCSDWIWVRVVVRVGVGVWDHTTTTWTIKPLLPPLFQVRLGPKQALKALIKRLSKMVAVLIPFTVMHVCVFLTSLV